MQNPLILPKNIGNTLKTAKKQLFLIEIQHFAAYLLHFAAIFPNITQKCVVFDKK